jgi:hypothetical protein
MCKCTYSTPGAEPIYYYYYYYSKHVQPEEEEQEEIRVLAVS